MSAALSFALSLFMSFALVPLLMRHAAALGLVDKPDGGRKIHTRVIPRSGGIAIAAAVLIPVFYLSTQTPNIAVFLLSSAVVVVFGFLDDRYELHYKWKFLGQIIATAIFLSAIPEVPRLPFYFTELPGWISYGVLFFFILGVTNAVNLSDGLDGLAAGTVLLSLGLIAYIAYEAQVTAIFVITMALMGALLGFLRYNTHPARVFMGDTGSQFIGFTSAAMAVTATQHANSAVSPVLPLVILGLPIMDTLMVMAIRIRNGKSPFRPDKNHLHHQLIKLGLHHYEAVALIYCLQIVLILMAYFMRYESDIVLLGLYLAFACCCLAAVYIGRSRNWRFHPEIQPGQFVERRNLLLRKLSWLYLYSSRIITVCLGLTWAVIAFSVDRVDPTINWLALMSLVVSFLLTILLPRYTQLSTRIATYSASVLALYPFCIGGGQAFLPPLVPDLMIACTGLILALSIRMTRREQFQLDNQDILVLFILMTAPLLPFASGQQMEFDSMLLRLAVMLYAIEYLINKDYNRYLFLNGFAIFALFVIAIF